MKTETIPQEFARVLCEAEAGRIASIERHVAGKRYVRRFDPGNRLILLGGGHIAVPLCTMASLLDFSVTVVDDRPSFANSSRFPMAAHVICNDFTSAIRELNIRPTDYICIITRGHRWDGDCLRAILPGIMPSYLGMIGSRRRVTGLLTLLAEEGFDEAWLNMIHTPIGLKIGAETPAEIAVSICAEMIQHRRSHSIEESDEVLDRTDTDFAMLHFLAEAHGPAALMMVISTHDSTPVKSGTIMAMERIGRSFGTLGGGCGEAEVMRVAREMIGTGGSQVVEIEMSNDIAGDEGMVCGGSMRVLVEDIEP